MVEMTETRVTKINREANKCVDNLVKFNLNKNEGAYTLLNVLLSCMLCC